MKQSIDNKTLELPLAPRKGMTRAEIQKAYRERKRAAGIEVVTFNVDAEVAAALRKHVQFKDETLGEAASRILRDRLLRKR